MKTFPVLNPKTLGTNLESRQSRDYINSPKPPWAFRFGWKLDQNIGPSEQATVASGLIDFSQEAFLASGNRLASLLKLERQHRERLEAVSLDPAAQRLLSALDRETSIKWEDLPDRAHSDWTEALRSAVLLAGANLCEASPTRIRLSEYGDKLLAGSSPDDHATPEVESRPVR